MGTTAARLLLDMLDGAEPTALTVPTIYREKLTPSTPATKAGDDQDDGPQGAGLQSIRLENVGSQSIRLGDVCVQGGSQVTSQVAAPTESGSRR